ncbi:shikimate dehydrogenase [Shimia sp. FJ5]|uniref:shikimate dehydrogenase n=1 Tax=Shimia sp. FJ5 TaxID=3079054 RepID=UPI00261DF86A|nr:shikimate dehydrogenase [Shimia sp. FJ5]MDV4144662.1 shikimate dehydrogenase [Shimia sp. FJ5]
MTAQSIPLAAVIGHPIAHSKSPRLHGYWLRKYGIEGHYLPMDVAPDDLGAVIDALPKMGFVGANVTIPHKEAIMSLVDELSEGAKAIGAVNTLVFKDGKVLGDNTDGYGFIENLRQGAPEWQAEAGPAMVLGAGGAARAIVYSLLRAGVPEILLTNRTKERADVLRADFGDRIRVVDWETAEGALAEAATLVNTTSLGMLGKAPLEVSLAALASTATVTDIVYTPLETDLLRNAKEKGCPTVDGLGMLLHQAVPGFEAWFGTRPEVDAGLRKEVLA